MLKEFRECCEAHEKGAPIYPSPDNEGFYFLVRRLGTTQSTKEIEQIRLTKYGLFADDEPASNQEIMGAWLAEYGVTGWGGVLDPDTDKEIKFSRQAARQIFTNPAYLGLVSILINNASMLHHYLVENLAQVEEELKKS